MSNRNQPAPAAAIGGPGKPVTSNQIFAIILVGGKGKRLRPLSTDPKPKAFLSITKDNKTMFRRTVDRAMKIASRDNIIVVASEMHSELVKKDFAVKRGNLILEPVSRNTCPAIALAAFVLKKKAGDAIMVILPVDHYIEDEKAFLCSIRKAVDFVRRGSSALVTLGVEPTFPATEFGYIKLKAESRKLKANIYKVEKFIEKPDLRHAQIYIKNEDYLWNTGTFIFRALSILAAIKRFAPKTFDALKDPDAIGEVYQGLRDISIDYAVMEKADNIYCVKGQYGWQDIGSFASLAAILKKESRDFVLTDGKIVDIL